MMNEKELKRQTTEYLGLLEKWQLNRWRRRLYLLNETTEEIWLIRKVLKDREPDPVFLKAKLNKKYGIWNNCIPFPKDEDK